MVFFSIAQCMETAPSQTKACINYCNQERTFENPTSLVHLPVDLLHLRLNRPARYFQKNKSDTICLAQFFSLRVKTPSMQSCADLKNFWINSFIGYSPTLLLSNSWMCLLLQTISIYLRDSCCWYCYCILEGGFSCNLVLPTTSVKESPTK